MSSLEALQEFQCTKPTSNRDYSKFSTRINQIGDAYWLLEIARSHQSNQSKIYNWGAKYSDLPLDIRYLAQEFILKSCKGHTNPDTGRIVLQNQSAYSDWRYVREFFTLLIDRHPNHIDWRNLSVRQLLECLADDFKAFRAKIAASGRLKPGTGKCRLDKLMHILRGFATWGYSISPFSETLVTDIPSSTREVIKDYLEEIDLPYGDFDRRRHYRPIPFHIAAAWLAYIMRELSSDAFKIWRVHWLFLRICRERGGHKVFPNISAWTRRVEAIYRYEEKPFPFARGIRAIEHEYLATTLFDLLQRELGYRPTLEHLLRVTNTDHSASRLKASTTYLRHLYAAIAITSGARRSEIVNLKLSDFQEHTDEISKFKSYIRKTNRGLPTVRSIAGMTHRMASDCADLGPFDRRSPGVYLFSAADPLKRTICLGGKAGFFNDSYQMFLASLPEGIAREFKQELPTVSTHQARHLFAAFALRVSDGNVFEAIRKHFRHHLGSSMTKAYTDHKISSDEAIAIEKEYIREIVGRVAGKEKHGYFGPMVSHIEKLIDTNIRFWDAQNLHKLDDELNKLTARFHGVKVHEWGLCLTLKKTLTKSKCYNRRTKLPDYDKGSSFRNCSSCLHLLSHVSCREDIERIGINAHQTLSEFPVIGNTVRRELENTLKQVDFLLKKLNLQEEH